MFWVPPYRLHLFGDGADFLHFGPQLVSLPVHHLLQLQHHLPLLPLGTVYTLTHTHAKQCFMIHIIPLFHLAKFRACRKEKKLKLKLGFALTYFQYRQSTHSVVECLLTPLRWNFWLRYSDFKTRVNKAATQSDASRDTGSDKWVQQQKHEVCLLTHTSRCLKGTV